MEHGQTKHISPHELFMHVLCVKCLKASKGLGFIGFSWWLVNRLNLGLLCSKPHFNSILVGCRVSYVRNQTWSLRCECQKWTCFKRVSYLCFPNRWASAVATHSSQQPWQRQRRIPEPTFTATIKPWPPAKPTFTASIEPCPATGQNLHSHLLVPSSHRPACESNAFSPCDTPRSLQHIQSK